ncbi:NAD(P)-dependent oxidoreductase [Roseomonas nepalensis]|uniref:NAD(P)-dependent oxidoreductase n=1 Tax=Muricoccus nepalensis TaxID=1854500 RepID=A0A502F8U9_9PROT|nr:NAD(P)-dependent oxidoreductase [Roseomonas nepalensis]TPG45733.1 NAD(P)-dependent oxidoreductase [Roseomonas nepalensis]
MAALRDWKLGWIGVGRMGTPLCHRLIEAGAALGVADTDPARLAPMAAAGARPAVTAAALAEGADILLSMVPNDLALLSVVTGPGGLAETMRPGQVLIDLSTVSPAASARVAEVMAARGADYLRCPVSGSTSTAAAGALTIFASGPEAALDRCAPLLAVLGRETLRCGAAEEARAVKLMVNMVVALTPAILGEALAFGGRLGLDWSAMVDALSKSVVASPLLAYKAEMLKARDWTPAADVDLVAKDLDLALAVGQREGAPMPLSALARQFAAAYQASGEGGLDFFRVATWPERLLAPNPR